MKREHKRKKEAWVVQMLNHDGTWATISEYWISKDFHYNADPMTPRSLSKCVFHAKMLYDNRVSIGGERQKYQYRLVNTHDEKETIPAEIL